MQPVSSDQSFVLWCAGKAGNPFQTTQGNRLSCRDQEGRGGSEEEVPGPSVFPSGEPGVSGAEGQEPQGLPGPTCALQTSRGAAEMREEVVLLGKFH